MKITLNNRKGVGALTGMRVALNTYTILGAAIVFIVFTFLFYQLATAAKARIGQAEMIQKENMLFVTNLPRMETSSGRTVGELMVLAANYRGKENPYRTTLEQEVKEVFSKYPSKYWYIAVYAGEKSNDKLLFQQDRVDWVPDTPGGMPSFCSTDLYLPNPGKGGVLIVELCFAEGHKFGSQPWDEGGGI
ncbi:hypothetical protein HYS48_05360 [Candidatus Woesearchaeota archaeon]|nr:hypothetical protein [Candidatus Woesearchaeota archaeon]